MKKMLLIPLTAVLLVTLSACAAGKSGPRTQTRTPAPAPITDYNANNPNAGNVQNPARGNTTAQNAPDGKFREAQNIANALVGRHNIQRASVFVTDQTAYVAVDIPNTVQGQLTDQIKNSVANEVRRVDPSVQQVYVSADPAVMQQFQGFSNDIRNGQPIQGLYTRFTEVIRRMMPQQR
ncbi:YhcN/YlaJ family sporulation lipoprotein [Effusibacillus dendaii]|uniref:YhcN/YlaJ family sporulation lipoprotein n=1 Tax=Effusibacillus dendaii TaxID=2743772 RepID=A0A7I8D7F5_9BACL|nr:YhcN/YlaJ family sporulation lipoprotein [Effusibacillus dendaii]BCJ85937.1 hypothetical protein skT53_09220 [Effusibacillus dendaii]